MSARNTGFLHFQHKNIMLITLHLSTAVSNIVFRHLCTRPRIRAECFADTPAVNPPHADRTRSAAPALRADSRHTWRRPASPPCLLVCCFRTSPQPPAPTHPTRATLLPFAHLLTVFSCYTVIFMLYNIFSATQQRKALQFRAPLVNNSIS